MKPFISFWKNEKGYALVTVSLASIVMLIISGATYSRAYIEGKHIEREISKFNAQYAAEGGIQSAMVQIGSNAYTGFINESDITLSSFQNAGGTRTIGSVNVDISYPSQADWVIVESEATVSGQKVRLEGRIFLDSNLSKYMMYSPAATHGYGANLQIGFADTSSTASSAGVPANELDRNLLYYTGNLAFNGTNVTVYGDIFDQGYVNGNGYTGSVHGDAYIGSFATNSGGVTNSGLTNNSNITLTDGFSDDLDRNGDGNVNSTDVLDVHDLTSDGAGDSKKTETLVPINTAFYAAHNNVTNFNGASAQNRYLKFVPTSDGTATQVVEYTNGKFITPTGTSYTLPSNAIVYVNGSAYVQGEIKGRVSLVTTNDILFTNNLKYSGAQNYVNENHAVAFLAQDKIYFLPSSLEVSGILYAEKSATGTSAITAAYKLGSDGVSLVSDSGAKTNGHFRHYGNIIMEDGSISTSQYTNDRAFLYDAQMKYYRPPGLPVVPSLRMVRENAPT